MNFYNFLFEDKSRFIKKNQNLSTAEQAVVIDFFKKNRQAEKSVDWNKAHTMSYEDFLEIMSKFKSGRQMVLKHKPISGIKEKEDYVRLKLNRNDYLAYAALTIEGSRALGSSRVGPCRGTWCVAHSTSSAEWNNYTRDGDVFVYVMNTETKWAVQIHDGNKYFEVWDYKDHSGATIPGFDVEKELLTPALKKLYDEIREQYENEIDIEDATTDYDNLVHDIQIAANDYVNAREWFYDETSRIKEETKDSVQEKIDELEDELADAKTDAEKARKQGVLPGAEKFVDFDAEVKRIEAEIEKLEGYIDEIEAIEYYEMSNQDPPGDIEWVDDPPNEEYIYDDVRWPHVRNNRYADYFTLAEQHMGFSDYDGLQQDIDEYIYEAEWSNNNAEEILQKNDCYHPESVNN